MPDPQQELEEKIKAMSPEELREFQKKQCIFCHIISGKVQSRRLYSDDLCTAILDINPASPGHILLLPNDHYAIMPLIPDDLVGRLFRVAKHLSHASLKALKSQGTTVFVANGIAAGQRAQHFIAHVIPRMPDDGLPFDLPRKQMTEQDMSETHKMVRLRLNQLLGIQNADAEPPTPREPELKHETKHAAAHDKLDFNVVSDFLRRQK
jgi:histidine triad (HIT) family protein